jgi:S1-C subfamily serine protease
MTVTDAIEGSVRRTVAGPGTRNVARIDVNAIVSGGSSGGPVVNAAGRLIGITTRELEGSGGSVVAVTPINLAFPLIS